MTKMTLTKAKSVLRAWDMNSPSTAEAFKVIAADYTRQATKTPATAIAALHRAGIVTKTGRLSRRYTPKK